MRYALLLSLLAAACETAREDSGTLDSAEDTAVIGGGPTPEFDPFCRGTDWTTTTKAATLPEKDGKAVTYLPDHTSYGRGTVELEKLVPTAPFHVTKVRVLFAEGDGKANVRLMHTLGRSYPAGYPDLDSEGANVGGPWEVEVSAAWEDEVWTEIDVSEDGLFLLPTQHYALVNEYPKKGAPTVALMNTKYDANSRALLIVDGMDEPYGLPGDYLMMLEGETFCEWAEADRWFAERTAPFNTEEAGNLAMADLNGDGHDDLVTTGGQPKAWLGDGAGAFANATEPWAEAMFASWMLFGDVDNDGDEDAFAASYVSADGDGDLVTLSEGDCNDVDANVHPGAEDLTDGIDNDCDGMADDGTDASDADGDGASVAAGDCDDTEYDRYPGAREVKDSIDNDCDLEVDEDFPSQILLNDGTGEFSALAGSGVEVREPSTAGAFGDGNEDGMLDLYFANWLEHYPDDPAVQDRYYEGAGGGMFTDAFDAAGLRLPTPWSAYGMEWTDTNNDGHPDMLVANYHLFDNQLWQNQGDGTFVDVAADVHLDHDQEPTEYPAYPGGHSYGGDFGDIDNDGDMDAFQANLCHPRTYPWSDQSTLNINDGAPNFSFTNEAALRGLEYDEGDVHGQFGDYDNDGDLDLLVSSLYPNHYPRVYQNQGDGTFVDVTYEVGLNVETSWGILWADVDEDGDLDFLVAGSYGDTRVHLFENRIGTQNHWVELKLEGTSTNRNAAGARVTLTSAGVTRIRDVQVGGGSFNQQRPFTVHFGLGEVDAVDSVAVRWVGGATETFTGVGADGRWRLVEGAGVAAGM